MINQELQRFLALGSDVVLDPVQFGKTLGESGFDLLSGNLPVCEDFDQTLGEFVFVVQGQEGLISRTLFSAIFSTLVG